MPDPERPEPEYKDPRKEDIVYGDRRISRPDVSLPDWEVPDAAYRPVPIVWFTGALFVEIFVLGLLALIFASQNAWITIAVMGLATGAVGAWTWQRGMAEAGTGWKFATFVMLASMYGFVCAALSAEL